MKIFLVGIILWLMVACTPPATQAQQPPQPPRPMMPIYEVHFSRTPYGGDFQITYFEHDDIRCYITREHSGTSYGGTSSGGGISCVRK